MTDRLEKIFSALPSCNVFADIGCDHGYMALAMIKSQKAKKVIVADISEKCLFKAQTLLSDYIKRGIAKSVVADGFCGLPECDLALIAGMGGEEICSILKKASSLPNSLALQPMKNTDKVRKLATVLGYKIERDYMFKSASKFYDFILLTKGKDSLTEQEIEFGRDNLKGDNLDFKEFISIKIQKINSYLTAKNLSLEDRQKMLKNKEKLEKYV